MGRQGRRGRGGGSAQHQVAARGAGGRGWGGGQGGRCRQEHGQVSGKWGCNMLHEPRPAGLSPDRHAGFRLRQGGLCQ